MSVPYMYLSFPEARLSLRMHVNVFDISSQLNNYEARNSKPPVAFRGALLTHDDADSDLA